MTRKLRTYIAEIAEEVCDVVIDGVELSRIVPAYFFKRNSGWICSLYFRMRFEGMCNAKRVFYSEASEMFIGLKNGSSMRRERLQREARRLLQPFVIKI